MARYDVKYEHMLSIRENIIGSVVSALKKEVPDQDVLNFEVASAKTAEHGEYATNIAFILSKKVARSPRDVAEQLKKNLEHNVLFEKIEIAGPGFINFFLKKTVLQETLSRIHASKEKFGGSDSMKGKKIMVEFAHPNTHKAFHIGHLRNICLGSALVRIFESQSAHVFRANYQGDIGLHVAKFLWAYMKNKKPANFKTHTEKTQFLGAVYAEGAKAYED